MKNILTFLLLTVASVAMGQNADVMAAQKMCYDQATAVEAKYADAQQYDQRLSWNNHYDARTKTCWVLEVRPLDAPGFIREWVKMDGTTAPANFHGVMVRVFNPFNHDFPVAKYSGNSNNEPIDTILKNEGCHVGEVRCLDQHGFEVLISTRYGFPEDALLAMVDPSWWSVHKDGQGKR